MIVASLHAYHLAMVEGRLDTLEQLLEPQFSLTHITGHVQSMRDWVDVIRTGRFNYHSIHIDEGEFALRVMAEAVRRGRRGARINPIRPGIMITPLAKDELSGLPAGVHIAHV